MFTVCISEQTPNHELLNLQVLNFGLLLIQHF